MHGLGSVSKDRPANLLHHRFGTEARGKFDAGKSSVDPRDMSLHAEIFASKPAFAIADHEPPRLDQGTIFREISQHYRQHAARIFERGRQQHP